jgi:hypothetical protein
MSPLLTRSGHFAGEKFKFTALKRQQPSDEPRFHVPIAKRVRFHAAKVGLTAKDRHAPNATAHKWLA